jgi:hypothetical protein
VANASGTATITVTVTDGLVADSSNSVKRTFTVTVTAVNDLPRLNAITTPAAITEDAKQQTVNLSGITAGGNESQTLKVTATSSNTALIPNPTVTYTSPSTTGSLSYTPVANASGTATITVTVTDGQTTNHSITRTFTVKVNAVKPRTAFNEWISGLNVGRLTGPADDFDKDGLGNAMEYLMGSDPTKPNNGLSVVEAGLNTLKLRHSQSNTLSPNLIITYQWSTDLVEWKESRQTNKTGTTVDIVTKKITDNNAPASDLVEVTYTIDVGAPGKLFARVKVGEF